MWTNRVYRSVQKNVLGPEGKKMQERVWREVLAILEEKVPEVKEIVRSSVIV